MINQPKKIIIISNPDIMIARLHIDEIIENAINARRNMTRKDGGYTSVGKHCRILTANSTETDYGDIVVRTYFNYGNLTLNIDKQ